MIAVPLYVWLHIVVADDPLAAHSGAWMTWILIASTALFLITIRLLKPWLSGHRARGDHDEGSSLPPECCVVTATLGEIIQKEECRRRYGDCSNPSIGHSLSSVDQT